MFTRTVHRTYLCWRLALMFAYALTARTTAAQNTPELASLDMWIVQRYRSAQLLPDSTGYGASAVHEAGAPRVESARTPSRRDSVVALHFGVAAWRPVLATSALVQLADPTGSVSSVSGRVTARRAFRTPRKAGANDTVQADWRIGWAYLVAIPSRSANAAVSGLNGWALVETPKPALPKPARPVVSSPPALPLATVPRNH